jgi:hypothetical protein
VLLFNINTISTIGQNDTTDSIEYTVPLPDLSRYHPIETTTAIILVRLKKTKIIWQFLYSFLFFFH